MIPTKNYLITVFLLIVSISFSQNNDSKKINELIQKSLIEESKGDIDAAINTNLEILKINPKFVETLTTLAGLKGKIGLFDQEIKYAKEAIAIEPNYISAHINMANGHIGKGEYIISREILNAIANKDPKNSIIFYTIGLSYEYQGNFIEAEKQYKKSIQVDSKFENGYFNLAMTYANLGKFELAIDNLKKIIELNNNDLEAKALLAQFENKLKKK